MIKDDRDDDKTGADTHDVGIFSHFLFNSEEKTN